jgi:hypothetical protein
MEKALCVELKTFSFPLHHLLYVLRCPFQLSTRNNSIIPTKVNTNVFVFFSNSFTNVSRVWFP